MTKFQKIRAMVDVLEMLSARLDEIQKDTEFEYKCISEVPTDRQKKHWRTGELVFDEDGNPVYETDRTYDYVKKQELDDEDRAKMDAIESIRKALDKLM